MSFEDKSIQTIDITDELLYIGVNSGGKGKYRLSYRGYKKALLAKQLSSKEMCLLLCSICEGILLNASSDQTGDILCECCVSDSVSSTPLLPIRRIVSKLLVKCPQYFRGCKWSGFISDIREHVDLCGYLYISCPQGCDESMLQQHTEEHVTHTCIERMISCSFCTKLFKAKNLTEHHGVCLMYPIDCTKLCGLGMKRYQLEDHLELDCPYRLVPCPYVKYGCDKTEIRYCDLKEHMDTKKDQHLSNLEKSHQMLEQTLKLNYQLVEKKDEELESNMFRVEKDNNRLKAFISPQLIKVCLNVGCYQDIRLLTFGNGGTELKLRNDTFYINLVREQNGRLYLVMQSGTPCEDFCLTILLNQDKSDESIVFQPMELDWKPKIPVNEVFEKMLSRNFYISHISSGIEESLLRYPFVKDGKVILYIGFK